MGGWECGVLNNHMEIWPKMSLKKKCSKQLKKQIKHNFFSSAIWVLNRRGGWVVVSYPTRWSLLFVFGFLWWSSSWQWQPHIVRGKMLTPLLRAGLTVFGHFFLQNVFFMGITKPQKKFGGLFLSFSPKNWMINSTHGAFRRVFRDLGINPQISKNSCACL